MSVAGVIKKIKDEEIAFVNLRFTDSRGKEQHVTVNSNTVDKDFFKNGKVYDGSSVAAWKGHNTSCMILMPDEATAIFPPYSHDKTLNICCDIIKPEDMSAYERDPRSVAKNDREFVMQGDVFTNDMIKNYLELKQEEVDAYRMATHPIEFQMYYSL